MKIMLEYDWWIVEMIFVLVYLYYIIKVEKKGRIKEELYEVIEWLIGFDGKKLDELVVEKVIFEIFFEWVDFNFNVYLIIGVICGYWIEEIEMFLIR